MSWPEFTLEQWGDVITLGMLGLVFTTMLYYELRRTWRWERLGIALTVITGVLAFIYSVTFLDVFVDALLWVPVLRWSARIVLLGASIATVLVLRFDDPDREGE